VDVALLELEHARRARVGEAPGAHALRRARAGSGLPRRDPAHLQLRRLPASRGRGAEAPRDGLDRAHAGGVDRARPDRPEALERPRGVRGVHRRALADQPRRPRPLPRRLEEALEEAAAAGRGHGLRRQPEGPRRVRDGLVERSRAPRAGRDRPGARRRVRRGLDLRSRRARLARELAAGRAGAASRGSVQLPAERALGSRPGSPRLPACELRGRGPPAGLGRARAPAGGAGDRRCRLVASPCDTSPASRRRAPTSRR
jgi:hypothetical protein